MLLCEMKETLLADLSARQLQDEAVNRKNSLLVVLDRPYICTVSGASDRIRISRYKGTIAFLVLDQQLHYLLAYLDVSQSHFLHLLLGPPPLRTCP